MSRPLRSTLFPYTTLFRSYFAAKYVPRQQFSTTSLPFLPSLLSSLFSLLSSLFFSSFFSLLLCSFFHSRGHTDERDRKRTRLNSSHRCISYAVFCLKIKNL